LKAFATAEDSSRDLSKNCVDLTQAELPQSSALLQMHSAGETLKNNDD